MLLFRALSLFLSTPLYAEVVPHSIYNVMQCKAEGGEAVYQSKRQKKYSATVLEYISPKRQQRYPANNADIYQKKRQQKIPKAAYEFCP
jgi:hypothetical protein